MPHSACLIIGVAIGAPVGFVLMGHDVEGAVIGTFVGLFFGMGMHANRWFATPTGMAALAVAGLGVIAAAELGLLGRTSPDEAGFVWRDGSVELRPVRQLKGVKLGEPLGEVKARLGTLEADESAPSKDGALNYVQRGGRIRLRVVGDRVTRVSYECALNDEDTRLNRIRCHTYDTRIIEVFGQAVRRLCGRAGPSAPNAAQAQQAFAFDVLDTGTRYVVLEGFVRGFIVMEPQDLEGAVGGEQPWQPCS